jgi:serine/threonine protein phosphatase 1
LSTTHTLVTLRGNHDIMMSEARRDQESFARWIENGGDKTLRSYSPFEDDPGKLTDVPDSHWHFLDELEPYFEIGTHFFVHANAYPDIPLADQPDFMLYWEKFNDPPMHESGKIMVCGHTSQKSGLPLTNGNAICIDTFACGGQWLSCLHVESGVIWQANEEGETRQLQWSEYEEA